MLQLILCFLILIGLPTDTWAERVPIDAGITTLPLKGFLSASPAGASPATPEEALALYRRGGFERLPGYLGRGFSKDTVWLAVDIDLAPGAPRTLIADVGPAYLDTVRAYQADSAGLITQLGQAGDQTPLHEVVLRGLRPAFTVRPIEGTTLLLEIRTSSTQAAIVKLHSGPHYLSLRSAEGLIFGAVSAINLIMAMGALTLYLLFRDRAYLVWMLYVLLTCVQWLALDGLLYLYIPWEHLSHLNLATNIFSVLLFSVGALLSTTLFQFQQIHPWLHRIFVGWAIAMILPLIAVPFGGAAIVGTLGRLGLPLFVLGMAAVVIQILRGHRASRIYGPMYVIHMIASMINILAVIGHSPFSELTLYGWQLTNFFNLLSLQVSMFMRMRNRLHENERQRLLLMQELSHKNVELEHQVAERTASLAQALRNVQQAESEQRQLLSMASHEFRTPAAMIKTSLDSLRFLVSQIPPEVARRLHNIEHASTRLTRLSNTLIHQDRLRELALRPTLVQVDLHALMEEVAARYIHALPDASTPLVTLQHPAGTRPELHISTTLADPALLSIALHNLIDNALQHGRSGDTPTPYPVSIALDARTDRLELRVADRGPGIPDSDKTRIFQRFHTLAKKQLSDFANPIRTSGDGLGLSIVHAIATAHGGCVYATDNPGGGAILAIRLPRVTEPSPLKK
ncbi:sensor histidine kinase [Zoogloea sp. LCSB751]|uniref:sensor histidine kinase n=1 Tax=Zoogloea sp. LCSB751 TaxID=1965277 RepID=UPI0009A4E8BD|nr:sensor histidine kinase [Zoogloea sp. LCSB751]